MATLRVGTITIIIYLETFKTHPLRNYPHTLFKALNRKQYFHSKCVYALTTFTGSTCPPLRICQRWLESCFISSRSCVTTCTEQDDKGGSQSDSPSTEVFNSGEAGWTSRTMTVCSRESSPRSSATEMRAKKSNPAKGSSKSKTCGDLANCTANANLPATSDQRSA